MAPPCLNGIKGHHHAKAPAPDTSDFEESPGCVGDDLVRYFRPRADDSMRKQQPLTTASGMPVLTQKEPDNE